MTYNISVPCNHVGRKPFSEQTLGEIANPDFLCLVFSQQSVLSKPLHAFPTSQKESSMRGINAAAITIISQPKECLAENGLDPERYDFDALLVTDLVSELGN